MFIEDIITTLSERADGRSSDGKFLISLSKRVSYGRALTTRQGFAFINLLKRNAHMRELAGCSPSALEALLAFPKWRVPLEDSREIRNEVRYLGDNFFGLRSTSSHRDAGVLASLDAKWSQGMHVVQIDRASKLEKFINFVGGGFDIDSGTETFLAEALSIKDQPSQAFLYEDQIIIDVPLDNTMGDYILHILQGEAL